MNTLSVFVIGVVSSLAAMGLVSLLCAWRYPTLLSRISSSRIFRHGVERAYPSQADIEKKMAEDLRNSATVKILAMRGDSTTRTDRPFRFLLDEEHRDVKLLLADPGVTATDNPEIAKRAKECKGQTAEMYWRDIQASIDRVREAVKDNASVNCKLHRLPACHRIYICDHRLYLSFFMSYKLGSQQQILSVRKGSPLYRGMNRHFDQTWQNAQDLTDEST